MTQKQIRRRREVIDAKFAELWLQAQRLHDERRDLRKHCAHSDRVDCTESDVFAVIQSLPNRSKKIEECNDCGEHFFYK